MSFRLGYHLVQQNAVDLESMDRAVRRQLLLGGSLDTSLLELELVSLHTLQHALPKALEQKTPPKKWLEKPESDALSFLPLPLVEQLQIVPVALEKRTAHILVADVGPPAEHLPLSYWFHRDVKVYPVPHVVLWHGLHRLYRLPIPDRLKTLAQRLPCEDMFQAPEAWSSMWSPAPVKTPPKQVEPVQKELGAGEKTPPEHAELSFPETAPFVSGEEPTKPASPSPSRTEKRPGFNGTQKPSLKGDEINRTTIVPDPDGPRETVKVEQSSTRRKVFREEEQTNPSKTFPQGLRQVEETTAKSEPPESTHRKKKRITPTFENAPTPKVDVSPIPDAATEVYRQTQTPEDRAPASRLDLPPVDSLRSAFRKSNEALKDEATRVEGQERPASEAAMLSKTKAATVQTPSSLRDTITERKASSLGKDKAPRNAPRPEPNGDTSEGLALTSENAVKEGDNIAPFETSLDLSVAVNAVEQRLKQDTEPAPPPHAIFELAELFKPELPGPHTVPGLPAFPAAMEGRENDIFPEVTMPDTGWMTLTEEDEQVDVAIQLDEVTDSQEQDSLDTDESVDVKVELDEYLGQWDETLRKPLLKRLSLKGSSLIPMMLLSIPAMEQMPTQNRALKERMERLVELCDAIGEPALFRLLQIVEKGKDVARMQAITLLGEWQPPRAIAPLLQRLLHEKSPTLQRMICNNLRQHRGREEFDKLLAFLRDNLESDDKQRLQKALFFLGHLRVVEAVADVMVLLQHDDAAIRESALEILRLLTLQNFDGEWETWSSWWGDHGQESRKQWILNAMHHPELSVRTQVKEELRLEFGDDFGFVPDASHEERETVRKLAALWIKQG